MIGCGSDTRSTSQKTTRHELETSRVETWAWKKRSEIPLVARKELYKVARARQQVGHELKLRKKEVSGVRDS